MVLGDGRDENLCGLPVTSHASLQYVEADSLDHDFGSNLCSRICDHLVIHILHPNLLPMAKRSYCEVWVNACSAGLWLRVHR